MDERLQAWTDDGGDHRATGLFRTAFEVGPDGKVYYSAGLAPPGG